MATRTDKIAEQLKTLGLEVKVTAQLNFEEDGEIEIVGTKFSVQVGHRYLSLTEDVSDKEGFALRFYDERRTVNEVYRDYSVMEPSKVKTNG